MNNIQRYYPWRKAIRKYCGALRPAIRKNRLPRPRTITKSTLKYNFQFPLEENAILHSPLHHPLVCRWILLIFVYILYMYVRSTLSALPLVWNQSKTPIVVSPPSLLLCAWNLDSTNTNAQPGAHYYLIAIS